MSIQKKQDILDNIASVYTEENGFEVVLQKYKILEVEKFCVGDTMLDVGCGVGEMVKALAPRFKRVVGIDGSPSKIRIAKQKNGRDNVEYILSFFEDYKPTEKFDFITCTNVLEHVEDGVAFLKLLKSWTSKEGKIVVTVPNALGLHKRIGMKMGLIKDYYALTEADIEKGHVRIYDMNSLKKDFEKAGLSIEHIGGILLKPLSHTQMERWDSNVVDALYELGHELPEYCSSLIVIGNV